VIYASKPIMVVLIMQLNHYQYFKVGKSLTIRPANCFSEFSFAWIKNNRLKHNTMPDWGMKVTVAFGRKQKYAVLRNRSYIYVFI